MKLAEEHLQPREEEHINALLELLKRSLAKEYPEGQRLRRFHPKGHGLVKAEFRVMDNLSAPLAKGIFKPGALFQTWIRFSNAPPTLRSDLKGSPKGMAIKLLDTGLATLEADPLGFTQDFVLTTSSVLVPATVKAYYLSMKALFGNSWSIFAYAINPLHWRTLALLAKGRIKAHNLLELTYHSSTAFLHGNGQAVKWMVVPRKSPSERTNYQWHENHLRNNLQMDLRNASHSFDFGVQLQTDPYREPVENTGKAWKTPFIKLAEIHIPKQEFDTPEREWEVQQLQFSPWHCAAQHRPLGGNNRVRRMVYREMARFRLQSKGSLQT